MKHQPRLHKNKIEIKMEQELLYLLDSNLDVTISSNDGVLLQTTNARASYLQKPILMLSTQIFSALKSLYNNKLRSEEDQLEFSCTFDRMKDAFKDFENNNMKKRMQTSPKILNGFYISIKKLAKKCSQSFEQMLECDLDYEADHPKVDKLINDLTQSIKNIGEEFLDPELSPYLRKNITKDFDSRKRQNESINAVLSQTKELREKIEEQNKTISNLYRRFLRVKSKLEVKEHTAELIQAQNKKLKIYLKARKELTKKLRNHVDKLKFELGKAQVFKTIVEGFPSARALGLPNQLQIEPEKDPNSLEFEIDDQMEVQADPDDVQELLQDLSLKVETLENGNTSSFNQERSFLAVKNEQNYLIAVNKTSIKVVKNGKKVYYKKLVGRGLIRSVVYCEKQDCYFLNMDGALYKKTTNSAQFYLALRIELDSSCGTGKLAYSAYNNIIIAVAQKKHLAVINAKSPKVEILIKARPSSGANFIYDYQVVGTAENRVVAVSRNGYLLLYEFDVKKKSGSILHIEGPITVQGQRGSGQESGLAIAVCSKSKYVCVELERSQKTSRNLIYEIEDQKLVFKANLDCSKENLNGKWVLGFSNYLQNHALFVGMGFGRTDPILVLDFNENNGELRELTRKRIVHKEFMPTSLQKIGSVFYYSGSCGSVMRLTFEF